MIIKISRYQNTIYLMRKCVYVMYIHANLEDGAVCTARQFWWKMQNFLTNPYNGRSWIQLGSISVVIWYVEWETIIVDIKFNLTCCLPDSTYGRADYNLCWELAYIMLGWFVSICFFNKNIIWSFIKQIVSEKTQSIWKYQIYK